MGSLNPHLAKVKLGSDRMDSTQPKAQAIPQRIVKRLTGVDVERDLRRDERKSR